MVSISVEQKARTASPLTIGLTLGGCGLLMLPLLVSAARIIATYSHAGLLGAAICASLFASTCIWTLGFAIFIRRTLRRWSIKGWAVLFLGGIVVTTVAGLHDREVLLQQQKIAARGLRGAYAASMSGKVAPAAPIASGEIGSIQRLTQDYLAAQTQIFADYGAALKATGMPERLQPPMLTTATDFAPIHASLREADTETSRHQQRSIDEIAVFHRKVEASELSPSSKARLLAGLDKEIAESRPVLDREWAIEHQAIGRLEAIATLLERRRGHWLVEHGKIAFRDQIDLDAFKAEDRASAALVAEMLQIQAKERARISAGLSRLEEGQP